MNSTKAVATIIQAVSAPFISVSPRLFLVLWVSAVIMSVNKEANALLRVKLWSFLLKVEK
jgi:hypothetical protein